MNRILAIAGLIVVAACTQQDPGSAPSNEVADVSIDTVEETTVPALEGSWRVTAIDGKPVGAGPEMTASFEGDHVTVSSGCFRRAWTYTQKRNVVSFAADPSGSSNCGGSSPDATQETAYAALEGASIAIISMDGGETNLSGTSGNLTLQRR